MGKLFAVDGVIITMRFLEFYQTTELYHAQKKEH